MPAAAPVPRERLTTARIVEGALDLARREGVHGLSMRPLAARFGVSATALYGHVASRDALLGLMLDHVMAGVPDLADGIGWEETLRRRALQWREAFGPYPQLALEALSKPATREHARADREQLEAVLCDAGFDADEAEFAVHAWARYVLSFLAAVEHVLDGEAERLERSFVYGLDLLLAGLREQAG